MGFSDKDKILIKNFHDLTGYRANKANERVSWKRLEQKWTVMQRCVYPTQIYGWTETAARRCL